MGDWATVTRDWYSQGWEGWRPCHMVGVGLEAFTFIPDSLESVV